ncbi:MAG: 5-dehydro-4-deoxy-D-glucuronate isomerase [Clostridiales bacterium]|nr:5-dehydro-4-deoxy-D-glucuronate isomerase [Clostridiales bacterium]
MELRNATNPIDFRYYDTTRLRQEFLIEDLFHPDSVKTVYSHIDRIITGSAVPAGKALGLPSGGALHAKSFLERRELGVINIGASGSVTVDGKKYSLRHKDGLYIGSGAGDVVFESADANSPAMFYFNSAPAHRSCPTMLIKPEDCAKVELGSQEESNHRTICKYILPGQVESCQLVMGMTNLMPGNVWNTMPCHTHDRRMEVYLYFNLDENAVIFHYMGQPSETRHIVVRNRQAVISPSWSIHSASGTKGYSFIWGMVGENQAFDDMDAVPMQDLK